MELISIRTASWVRCLSYVFSGLSSLSVAGVCLFDTIDENALVIICIGVGASALFFYLGGTGLVYFSFDRAYFYPRGNPRWRIAWNEISECLLYDGTFNKDTSSWGFYVVVTLQNPILPKSWITPFDKTEKNADGLIARLWIQASIPNMTLAQASKLIEDYRFGQKPQEEIQL